LTLVDVRKTSVLIETAHHDGGPRVDPALRKGVIATVLANPFAGRYEPNLLPWMEALRPLGVEMARRLLESLQVERDAILGFGKGAIVGVEGEQEHAAIWHAPGGHGMREVLKARGFVTSGEMMGVLGTSLRIPLVYVNSPWVRSHFDSVELTIHDAPKPREVVFALAMSTGPRIHARLGGITPEQADRGEVPKA
jgi:hypothetical protein